MNASGSKSRLKGDVDSKFTKEYKSPQESRFRMASFTEMVKNKSKVSKPSLTNQPPTAKQPGSKLRPRYSYLSSTIKKPSLKAVKHQEIDMSSSKNPSYS